MNGYPENLLDILIDLHRMTTEQYKARKAKKQRLEARMAADPTARGPGRPRGPILKRIDGHQEFINEHGEKVKIMCFQREARSTPKNHVQRIVLAYEKLKAANVRVNVKNIRSLGIGAGTIIEHKDLLPDYITKEISFLSKSRINKKAELGSDNEHSHQEEKDTEQPQTTSITAAGVEIMEDHKEVDPTNNSTVICEEESELGLEDLFDNGFLANFCSQGPSPLGDYEEIENSNLSDLLSNNDFKNATFLVDGVFDSAAATSAEKIDSVRDAASCWIEEVYRQRRLHGLPLVNMRPSMPGHLPDPIVLAPKSHEDPS